MRRVETFGEDALTREIDGPLRDFEERQLAVGAGDREHAVAIDDIRFRRLEEVCCDPASPSSSTKRPAQGSRL